MINSIDISKTAYLNYIDIKFDKVQLTEVQLASFLSSLIISLGNNNRTGYLNLANHTVTDAITLLITIIEGFGWIVIKESQTQIPQYSDAFLHFDYVRIGETYVDKKNGRILTINNRDYDLTNGLPAKSDATLSPPVGDLAWIAADLNNFWYDALGDPNEIPVISFFFQNTDYGDRGFNVVNERTTRTISLPTEISGIYQDFDVEVKESHVSETVLYNTVKTGTDLDKCNSYFNVPGRIGGALWIDFVNGNDSTGTGTEGNPYKTIIKVETLNAANGNTVYIKSGIETLSTLWVSNKTATWTAIGNFKATYSSTRVIRCNVSAVFTRIYFEPNDTSMINVLAQSAIPTFNNCKFGIGQSGRSVVVNTSCTFNDCVIQGDLYNFTGDNIVVKTTGCLKNSLLLGNGNLFVYENKYSTQPVKDYGNGTNVDILIEYCKYTGSTIVDHLVSTTGSMELLHNEYTADQNDSAMINKPTGLDPSLSYIVRYNLIEASGYSCDIAQLINQPDSIFNHNILINSQETGNTRGVVISQNAIAAVHKINYNVVNQKKGDGAVFEIGNGLLTTGNVGLADGSEIIGNSVFGPRYYNNLDGTHAVLIINQQDVKVRYNRVIGCNLSYVIKANNQIAIDFIGDVSYNLSIESYLVARGIRGVKFYGNSIYKGNILALDTPGTGFEATGTIIKNNIIVGPSEASEFAIDITAGSYLNTDANNNTVYGHVKYQSVTLNGTLSEWQALGQGVNSQETDPLYSDPYNNDLTLQSNSPAIGNGVDLGNDYKTALDESTNWGNESTTPSVVTKDQVVFDVGAYNK